MNRKQTKLLFLFVALYILAGCSPIDSKSNPTNEIASTVAPVAHTPTRVISIEPSSPQTPSMTPTLAPTFPPTPTAIPTMTAIPTPPNVENEQEILWLLDTNNGCRLPCWWGITPGQTEWTTAKQFLNRYDVDIYKSIETSGTTYYQVTIPLSLDVFSEDKTGLGIVVEQDIVQEISIHFPFLTIPPGYLTHYYLSEFLTTYGSPTEIWVSTYSSFNELPFSVVLFYPDQGIVVLYSVSGVKQDDIVTGCIQQEPVRTFRLWFPPLGLTFDQIKRTSAFNAEYLSLVESTGIDLITFYERFKDPTNQLCLETPAELWP